MRPVMIFAQFSRKKALTPEVRHSAHAVTATGKRVKDGIFPGFGARRS